MGKYKVLLTRSARKTLKNLNNKDRKKILERIIGLSLNPRPEGCQKIIRDKYRIRYRFYRVVYMIEENILTVIIVKIGNRGDVYKN